MAATIHVSPPTNGISAIARRIAQPTRKATNRDFGGFHEATPEHVGAGDVPDRVQQREPEHQEQSERDRHDDHQQQHGGDGQQEERPRAESDRRARALARGGRHREVEPGCERQQRQPEQQRRDGVADPPDEAAREAERRGIEVGTHAALFAAYGRSRLHLGIVDRDQVAADRGA